MQAGLDYTKLRDLLAAEDFQSADDETRDALIRLAGPEAVKRKWVYFSEVSWTGRSPQSCSRRLRAGQAWMLKGHSDFQTMQQTFAPTQTTSSLRFTRAYS